MPKSSIKGYNAAAAISKNAAVAYCQEWKKEIAKDGLTLAQSYEAKRITLAEYNKQRAVINEKTKHLNACIQSLNKRFGHT